jgi:hypothetical protein
MSALCVGATTKTLPPSVQIPRDDGKTLISRTDFSRRSVSS